LRNKILLCSFSGLVLSVSLSAGTASAIIVSPGAQAAASAAASSTPGPAPQNRVTSHPQLKFKEAADATVDSAATISDGTTTLGVNPTGNLIADGVGLLYAKTGNDALEPGCPCEGWGVADPSTGTTGGADDAEGTSNLTVTYFHATATTASSTVDVGSEFKVSHYYEPSSVKGIFKGIVTITNRSGAAAPVLYRRVMDWDVAPSTFNEMVSVVTRGASDIDYSDDDGFSSFDPLTASSPILFSGQADDSGPTDHGALFDLSLGTLAPGASVKFTLFYGAAANKYDALTDLTRLKAESYSLGYPDDQSQQTNIGSPNTFIFGLQGVGGTPLPGAVVSSPVWGGSYSFEAKSSCPSEGASFAVTDTSGNPVSGVTFGLPVISGSTVSESIGGLPDGDYEIHGLCNGTDLGYETVHSGEIGSSYVAMGDSYASGEGSFSYLPGTHSTNDECHRATGGYAEQLAAQLGMSLDFAACSGATIPDFTAINTEGNGEQPQLNHLSKQTQLVTLSVGGNDVGFVPLITDCLHSGDPHPYGSSGCKARDASAVKQVLGFLAGGVPSGCYNLPGHLYPSGTATVCGPVESLTALYEQIGSLAPSARILVVGYPHLFGAFTGEECNVGTALGVERFYVSHSDAQGLNTDADALNKVISDSVSTAANDGINISFVDPTGTFSGHGLCDTGTSWINGLLFKPQASWPPAAPKVESFHPNTDGQNALYSLISGSLSS
jgi:lysophospholipase L1-like esterase